MIGKKYIVDGEITVVVGSLPTSTINQVVNKFNIKQVNSRTIKYKGSRVQEFLDYIYPLCDPDEISCYPKMVDEVELFRRHGTVRVSTPRTKTTVESALKIVNVNNGIEVLTLTEIPERVKVKLRMFETDDGFYYIKVMRDGTVCGDPIELPHQLCCRDERNPEYESPRFYVSEPES